MGSWNRRGRFGAVDLAGAIWTYLGLRAGATAAGVHFR